MRKLILVILLSLSSYSQTLELIGPPGGLVFEYQLKIHPTNPNILYSGTYYGALFKFDSDNSLLTPIEPYAQHIPVRDIGLPHNKYETIFIQAGPSYRSTNNGEQWELIEPTYGNTNFVFNSMNSDVVYMTRKGNEIWRSNNLGTTWKKIYTYEREDSTIIEQNITSLAISKIDTSTVYFGTGEGEIFRSTDSGLNWVLINEGYIVDVIETSPYNDNTLYLKLGGALAKFKVDNKMMKVLYPSSVIDFAINPHDTLTIYIARGSKNEVLYKTTDEGNNWIPKANGLAAEYIHTHSIEINPENPEELYAGIGYLGIYKTENGGEDWTYTNAANSDVITLYVDKENPGTIITGQSWTSMRTTNYGGDWYHPEFDASSQDLSVYDIDFNPFNKDQGFLLTTNRLFKTTDKGNSWVTIPNDLEVLKVLSFHPGVPGLIYGSTFEPAYSSGENAIYRSTDYGVSWQCIQNVYVTKFQYDTSNDFIYGLGALGSSLILHRSSDNGETWEVILSIDDFPEFEWLWSTDLAVSEIDPDNIYICFQQGVLLHSSNRGESWTRIDSTLKELDQFCPFSSIWLDEESPGRLYVGISGGGNPSTESFTNGGLYLTENNGRNWRQVYDSEVNLIKADDETPRNIYVGTKFGVKTFVDTLTVTSVRNNEKEMLPSEYVLYQNYPNPFNPITQIKFVLPQAENVTLKVFDMLGKEVITLVDGYMNPGMHNVQFDA